MLNYHDSLSYIFLIYVLIIKKMYNYYEFGEFLLLFWFVLYVQIFYNILFQQQRRHICNQQCCQL